MTLVTNTMAFISIAPFSHIHLTLFPKFGTRIPFSHHHHCRHPHRTRHRQRLHATATPPPTPIAASYPPAEPQPCTTTRIFPLTIRSTSISLTLPPRLLLFLAPALWSSFTVLVKALPTLSFSPTPVFFNTLRLSLSVLTVFPAAHKVICPSQASNHKKQQREWYIKGGLELGLWLYATNMSQVVALKFIGAGKVGFLSQIATIIVPGIAWICGGGIPSFKSWIAAIIAIFGVGFLNWTTVDGHVNSGVMGLGGFVHAWKWGGEGMALLSALFSAMYIWRSGFYARNVKPWGLVATKVTAQFLFSLIFVMGKWLWSMKNGYGSLGVFVRGSFAGISMSVIWLNLSFLFFAGVMSAVVSAWFQVKGQAVVPPSEAAVFFASTPLWTSLMALSLGERFGPVGLVGAALIVTSTLLASGAVEKGKLKEV